MFNQLKIAVDQQITKLLSHKVFRVDIDKDELWETYLNSFEEGTNPLYKERTEHDCQCCKQFIRSCGDMVAIIDNELLSIWDIKVPEPYQVVVQALAKLVKSRSILQPFYHRESQLGTDYNHQMLETGETIKWEHFHYKLPSQFVNTDAGTLLSDMRSNKEVLQRSLESITVEAAETVLELIEQRSIYRGEEHKHTMEIFLQYKQAYDELEDKHKSNFCWEKSLELKSGSKIRNTVIGTLLSDISEEVPLDRAVESFESKVAPTNYKRSSTLVTKGMIQQAEKLVKDLGIEQSLDRRYAITEDITINNVLYADRAVKKKISIFDELRSEISEDIGKLDKVQEVGISTFIQDILPKVESIELLLENKQSNNLMSLIAPSYIDAPNIFKWENNFSWSYNGELTDSIKDRVKKAGGRVDGALRHSLSWFNYDDLDLHLKLPSGREVSFNDKQPERNGPVLDVDMNVSPNGSRSAVENIVCAEHQHIKPGIYELFVRNYTKRESNDVGFEIELEYNNVIHTFNYTKALPDKRKISVVKYEYSKDKGVVILESLPSTQASKEVWTLNTQKFHRVSMIMNSPNYWDDQKIGNKHIFFILENCKNADQTRGFYNEFLNQDFTKHRKTFEVLASKMKVKKSDQQLSGLGFSITQKNQVTCRVTGSFTRIIKINF